MTAFCGKGWGGPARGPAVVSGCASGFGFRFAGLGALVHELVELGLVLGIAQTLQESFKVCLLFFQLLRSVSAL